MIGQGIRSCYKWCQPLDLDKHQIRLVKFRRKKDSGPTVQCDFATIDLADAPPYTALLYTLGEPAPLFCIRIDDHEYAVWNNLFDFLVTFREQVAVNATHIWID
jgi:hypothetical protein